MNTISPLQRCRIDGRSPFFKSMIVSEFVSGVVVVKERSLPVTTTLCRWHLRNIVYRFRFLGHCCSHIDATWWVASLDDRRTWAGERNPRCKAPRLEQDLLSLGMTEAEIAALPLCGRLPAIPSLPRAFGVLYAIEGITVGERIAAIHLLEQLRIDPSRGGSFFSSLNASYDPSLNSYWQEFIAVSESVEKPGPQIHAIEAAVDALDCLNAWLDYRHHAVAGREKIFTSTLVGARAYDAGHFL